MNTGDRIITSGFFMVLAFCVVIGCSQKSEPAPMQPVKLQLKWVHQAQFAGFYQAFEKGYYADEHIQVNFLEGGKEIDVLTSLVSGKAHFAVAASEMILMQRQQASAPITAIAVIYRKSSVVYATKVSAGISKPDDFIGKTAAVMAKSQSHGEFEYQFNALMKKSGVNIKQIHCVAYDPTFKDFYSGKVDITAAYYTGDVMQIRNKGYDLHLIWPDDYGIHFYSDTLTTTEQMISERPELIERFLRATLKGWREAIAYPNEAIDFTLKYAKVKDRELQLDMLSAMAPLVHTGKGRIGWMSHDVWHQMHRILVDQNILAPTYIDFNKVYTLKFLERVYPMRRK